MGLVDDVLAGQRRALARLATHIENDDEIGQAALESLYPRTGDAHIVGFTGPPGAGKSTLLNAVIGHLRARQRTVAVVAVDPTSPVSGGATLGDRIRMQERHADRGVFIRSMASRGRPGGLAPATAGMVHLLDAAGFDTIVVETVGVGQEEIAVARLVETLVLVQTPNAGDSVQLLKAGLLEVADIFVVNKADLPGASDLLRGLRSMVPHGDPSESAWVPPIVRCTASTGDGVVDLTDLIERHRSHLDRYGLRVERRRVIARAEIADRILDEIERKFERAKMAHDEIEAIVENVARRRISPRSAAQRVLSDWDESSR